MMQYKRLSSVRYLFAVLFFILFLSVASVSFAANPYDSKVTYNCTWYAWQQVHDRLSIDLPPWGNAGEWLSSAARAGYSTGSEARVNSLVVWEGGGYGHVAYVIDVNETSICVIEGGRPSYADSIQSVGEWAPKAVGSQRWARDPSACTKLLGYIYFQTDIRGSEMSSGYSRVLPDGDYLIVTPKAEDKKTFYYVDIEGTDLPAANGTNVSLCGPLSGKNSIKIPDYELWTISYSDGFYTIKQKGTNMCLDVANASTLSGDNVRVHTGNGSSAQKWAIQRDDKYGYRIRPKCSGGGNTPLCLDLANGSVSNGTQIRQWAVNNTIAQSWLFIPFQPSQPIDEGQYVILYTADQTHEIDLPGDTGDLNDATAIVIWSDKALSKFNTYEFTKLSNGYYKIKHVESGKCLDVTGGLPDYNTAVGIYTDNESISQQWAIVKNGSGYEIISRCNGYCLNLTDGNLSNGTQIRMYPRKQNDHQRWSFVQANYIVSYDFDGGYNGPSDQRKNYKSDLQLSSVIPQKEGYCFKGWDYVHETVTWHFQPGDIITVDQDMTLTAIWEPDVYQITYDANGGTGGPDGETVIVDGGGTITLPSDVPTRVGYDFKGWDPDPNATIAMYQPGDSYPGGNVTLHAIWEIQHFNVSFNSEGAGAIPSRTVDYGNPIGELPEPQREGYFFKGWYDDNTYVTSSTIVTSSILLTAHWSEPTRMVLPSVITTVEDEAFEGVGTNVFVIPGTVTTIGSKAFANNPDLYSVIIYADNVTPATDAFANCPNLTIYGHEDSQIHYYAVAKKIPFVLLTNETSDWVPYSEMPIGATVVQEKWEYDHIITETTTSTDPTMEGWTEDPSKRQWEQTETGINKYVDFKDIDFLDSHALYSKYNNKMTNEETTTNKIEITGQSSNAGYIYYHWTLDGRYPQDAINAGHAINVYVESSHGPNPDGYTYTLFHAFEVDSILKPEDGATTSNDHANLTSQGIYSTCYVNDYKPPEYVSYWWYITEIRQQPYAKYQRIFTFNRETTQPMESDTPVTEGDDVTNVRHYVKYGF